MAGGLKVGRSAGRMGLALIPMYQGRLDDALQVLNDGIGADRMEETQGYHAADKHRLVAMIHIEKGDDTAAVEAARHCMELRKIAFPSDPALAADVYIGVLAETGDLAEAERLVTPLKAMIEQNPEAATSSDWLVLGGIEHARGDYDQAATYLTRALDTSQSPYIHLTTTLAQIYIDAGRLGEAVEVLEAALTRYDDVRATIPIRSVKVHYWLGLAYEGSGWNAKAIEQYKTFLDIWKNADPGIPALEDARQRLACLEVSS